MVLGSPHLFNLHFITSAMHLPYTNISNASLQVPTILSYSSGALLHLQHITFLSWLKVATVPLTPKLKEYRQLLTTVHSLHVQLPSPYLLFYMSVKLKSLTLREEQRFRVFENTVLRRIFGPKRRKWQEAGKYYILGAS